MKISRLYPFLLLPIITGCIATAKGPSYSEAPLPKPDSESAVVYVYRAYAAPLAVAANISIDGRPIASLAQKGFTAAKVSSGEHRILLKWNAAAGTTGEEVVLQAKPGNTYVYEVVSNNYFAFIQSHLKETPAELGKVKLSACCKFISPKAITY